MIIWLYCLFGVEDMLMPYFLRHYGPQVDRLIMLSGGTNETTRRMVWECPHAEVHRSPFSENDYDDQAFVDYASQRYKEARGQADWVLWVDMDEFLWPKDGRLRHALTEYRQADIRAIKCDGYQMLAEDIPSGDGMLTDLVRLGVRDKIYDKVAAFDPALDVTWSVGRHSSKISGYEPVETGLKLLHYRWFGEEYHRERNARNWARRSEADVAAGRGYHGAPDHEGRYSAKWYQAAMAQAKDVLNG